MDIKYGSKASKEVIDENGSTKTLSNKFENYELQTPRRSLYEIRHRAYGESEASKLVFTLMSQLLNDPSKKDLAVRIEESPTGKKQGYCHVVECYTLLEY